MFRLDRLPRRKTPPYLAWLALLLVASLPQLFADLRGRGFTDNEAMYAEVARQMLRTGDWITPHLNGAPYLNKPPLVFWLTAGLYSLTGPTETARLIGGLAFLATGALLFDFARRLWPDRPGAAIWSSAVFLTLAQTPVEARFLRPDPLLVFFVTLSYWGAARATKEGERPARTSLVSLWGGMGLAVMSKGLVGLLLPLLGLVPALWLSGEWRSWRRYCPSWGVGLAVLILLPWHVAAGLRNQGFWWDYVVNQHLLFFFDRKFPRDSVPDTLLVTWGSFAGRLLPWLFFVPPALALQLRNARAGRGLIEWLPLAWFAGIGLFFSLSKGRQLHYLMPAIPAVALLLGALADEWSRSDRSAARYRWVPFAALAVVGLVLPAAMSRLFQQFDLEAVAPGLPALAERGFVLLGAGALVALVLAVCRRPTGALVALAATGLLFNGNSVVAMDPSGAFSSVRELTAAVPRTAGAEIVYEAGEEYQLCGGLNFYLRRDRIVLLEPPGFVAPTYLARDVRHLFTPRAEVWRNWTSPGNRCFLFTDPGKSLDRPQEFPHPYWEVGRGGGRLLLTNRNPR